MSSRATLPNQEGTSISEKARIFALIAMAVSDGLVSSMETKCHYNS